MTKLTWLSHASWLIETTDNRILLDPFFSDNPAAEVQPDQFDDVSHVLISHGHFDHVGDVVQIAKRSGATVIAIFEVAQWLSEKHGLENTIGMNIGGRTEVSFGSVKMTPAVHSSMLPDGGNGGAPAGFVLQIAGRRIYFACDTALFGDMKLYAQGVDLAVLPIGDLYTMGIDDSIAATRLIEPRAVLPTHYNTWPPITQNASQWAERIRQETDAQPIVLAVGESHTLD